VHLIFFLIKTLSAYLQRTPITLLFLGISSGVPFLLSLSTLSIWLAEDQIGKDIIGALMLTNLPYSLKFLIAPYVYKIKVPYVSSEKRRPPGVYRVLGIIAQLLIILSIFALALCRPSQNIYWCCFWCFLMSLSSAIQDISIDAYRLYVTNNLDHATLGPSAAMESVGFKIGMILSGGGTIYLAHHYGWPLAYIMTSGFILLGVAAFLSINTKMFHINREEDFSQNDFLQNFKNDFLKKSYLLPLIGFVIFFKTADTVLNAMAAPFLIEMGFSKLEFASVSKVFGLALSIAGGILSGVFIQIWGTFSVVRLCIGAQLISCLLFIVQGLLGYNLWFLFVSIGIESLTSGITATVFIAYLSTFSKGKFAVATFTLLCSIGSLSRIAASSLSGVVSENFGWFVLFLLAGFCCIPATLFARKIHQKNS